MVCCYARQDKHWVTGPDGQRWENYVVLADAGAELEGKTIADVEANPATDPGPASGGGCCGTSGFVEQVDNQVDDQVRVGACCR